MVTKHGLSAALQSDNANFEMLHAYFIDRLLPVATQLPDAAVVAGDIAAGIEPFELMRAIGNLCVGEEGDRRPADGCKM